MIMARVMVSSGDESEKYQGFHSFGVTYPGDLIDKLWGHRESYQLTGITIRKRWGGVKKVEILIVDGWFEGLKIEGGSYRSGSYKLDSVDASKVVLTPFSKDKMQSSSD